MNRFLEIFSILIITGCSAIKENKKTTIDLNGVFEQYAKESYSLNPLSATANNVNDYNEQLAINIGEEWIQKAILLNNRYLDTLKKINYPALTENDQRSVDVLRYQLSIQNEGLVNHYGNYRPVNQFVFSFPQRFAVLGSGAGNIPFQTEKDYYNFISRMKLFQVWIDQAIINMQAGLESGDTNPRASMEKVPAQLKPLFETEIEKNIFYKPLLSLPAGMDTATKSKLVTEYTAAIKTYIIPAYKKLNQFLESTYIPPDTQFVRFVR